MTSYAKAVSNNGETSGSSLFPEPSICENNLFPESDYTTPDKKRRGFWDRLTLGTRLYFYVRLLYIFYHTSKCAKEGRLDRERQIHYSNLNVKLVEACGGKIHLRGLDNLRKVAGTPVVLIGNHMSMLETALIHAIVRPHLDFTYVIKESLMTACLWGNIMQALKAIPVGRSNPVEDFKMVLKEGGNRLAEGRSIVVFPQASRSSEFKPNEFNTIGIKLAKRAKVKVVPFALKTDFLGNGKIVRSIGALDRKQPVYFEFGEPMDIENPSEDHKKIIDFITSRLETWNRD